MNDVYQPQRGIQGHLVNLPEIKNATCAKNYNIYHALRLVIDLEPSEEVFDWINEIALSCRQSLTLSGDKVPLVTIAYGGEYHPSLGTEDQIMCEGKPSTRDLVRVKELIWCDWGHLSYRAGNYQVIDYGSGQWDAMLWEDQDCAWAVKLPTRDLAKAACQAHYERTIYDQLEARTEQ